MQHADSGQNLFLLHIVISSDGVSL